MGLIENFERMLAQGTDSALLRFSLGNAYHAEGRFDEALTHLGAALAQDPCYSAAWKRYAQTLAALARSADAREAFQCGIRAAQRNGDIQAAREMQVFLKRLDEANRNPG